MKQHKRAPLESGLLHAMGIFANVSACGSFATAASQVQLAPSQISRTITELESRLNCKLLHRNSRRLVLTAAGKRYLERCRAVLDLVDDAEREASSLAGRPVGDLRVASMDGLGRRYVQPVLGSYALQYPDVSIEYITRQKPADIVAEEIDCSVFCAIALPSSALIARTVGEVSAVLAASPAYLARYGIPLTPTDLLSHSCLTLSTNPFEGWPLRSGVLSQTVNVRSSFSADSPEVVKAATIQGLGISLLPVYTAIDSFISGELVPVLKGWSTQSVPVFAVVSSRKLLPASTRALVNLLCQCVPSAVIRDEKRMKQIHATTEALR